MWEAIAVSLHGQMSERFSMMVLVLHMEKKRHECLRHGPCSARESETECEAEACDARRQLAWSVGHAEVAKVAHKTREKKKKTEDEVLYQRHCIGSCPEGLAHDLPQRDSDWSQSCVNSCSTELVMARRHIAGNIPFEEAVNKPDMINLWARTQLWHVACGPSLLQKNQRPSVRQKHATQCAIIFLYMQMYTWITLLSIIYIYIYR